MQLISFYELCTMEFPFEVRCEHGTNKQTTNNLFRCVFLQARLQALVNKAPGEAAGCSKLPLKKHRNIFVEGHNHTCFHVHDIMNYTLKTSCLA